MNFENNKEVVSYGIVVKEEMETNETSGIKIICFTIYNTFLKLYYAINCQFFYQNILIHLEMWRKKN